MKQTAQSANTNQQSQLRFILVNGLLKKGMLFAGIWFLCHYLLHFNYLFHFELEDFWGAICMSIIFGATVGLSLGLIDWHRSKRNFK
jgi:uncharacterized membrane protein YesL